MYDYATLERHPRNNLYRS